MKLMRLCECGCSDLVQRLGNRFLYHHHRKGKSPTEEQAAHRSCADSEPPLKVRKSLTVGRFLHADKLVKLKRLCACGCGGLVRKLEHRFLHNHHRRGIRRVFSAEHRRRIGEAQRGRVQTEEHKRKNSEGVRRFWDSPSGRLVKHRLSVLNTGREHTKEAKRQISKAKKGVKRSVEVRKQMSESHRGVPLSDEHKRNIGKAIQGAKHPNWQGGISFEPYPPEFNQSLKESIRKRDNKQCQNPDCWGTTERIVIHHIDYNKQNCKPANLIAVCLSCNGRANKDRKSWAAFYRKLVVNKQQAEVA